MIKEVAVARVCTVDEWRPVPESEDWRMGNGQPEWKHALFLTEYPS